MKMQYSQPDVETIVKRIEAQELNLQPNFQRGEVWSHAKKQRLIDSILRNWHVPPIHVIELSNGNQEVLDGQQRLVSIRDFVRGNLRVDGHTEPFDPAIAELDGFTFAELPDPARKAFNRFTITVNAITDYEADEPGELFYRLNQPIRLSSAEERNAFFGLPREQIKRLVEALSLNGIDARFLGFSNSRMAYDDVLARLCLSLEIGTLHEKVTSPMLANKYRGHTPFSDSVIHRVERAIQLLGKARSSISTEATMKFNRASLFSWLLFLINMDQIPDYRSESAETGRYLSFFEELRAWRRRAPLSGSFKIDSQVWPSEFVDQLMDIYIDRSTSRVTDVNSVLTRDIILWTFYGFYVSEVNTGRAPHPLLARVIDQVRLSNSGKARINPFRFLEQLMPKWDMVK